jgi:hypothetical protein
MVVIILLRLISNIILIIIIKPTFYTNQLYTTLLWARRPKARGLAECRRLFNNNYYNKYKYKNKY